MAKKKKKPTLPQPKPKPDAMPQTLYVVRNDIEQYFGRRDFDDYEHEDRVGIYELREVRTVHVTRGLR